MDITQEFPKALQYYQQGRPEEAAALCRHILSVHPDYPQALRLMAIISYQSNQYASAAGYIEKLLRIDPRDSYAFFLLGNIYQEQGDPDKAAEYFAKAVELNPSSADAHYNLAIVLERKNEFEKSLASYEKAIALNPKAADVYNNAGNVLLKMNRFDEAASYLGIAVSIDPDYALALANLALALKGQGRAEESVNCLERAIELNPSFADAHYNLAIILKEKNRAGEAAFHFQKAIESNPSFADAYCNLAIISEERGDTEEALAYYRKALNIDPDDAETHWNMSHALLSSGDFEKGWKEYEWRSAVKDFKQRVFPIPRWDGRSPKGKTLLINSEQGIGEEIMFVSCLPELIARADACIVECDKRLKPLFARSFPETKVISHIHKYEDLPQEISHVDMRISMASLPFFLRPDLNSFPQYESYLMPDPVKVDLWRDRFNALGNGLKIGVSWRGGAKASEKRIRSTVLEQWQPLFAITGVHFINLQYGDCINELREAKERLGVVVHDWDDADPLKDLDSFAAQVAALDLVVSVDNATVHMAGALGVPVWVLLPFACDWRWMRGYEDTPWYRSVRHIRQEKAGDWEGVFRRAAADLKNLIETGRISEIKNSYKDSVTAGKTMPEPVPVFFPLPSGRKYRCAVITPVGPGHGQLYLECLASVENSFAKEKGIFSEIIPVRIDDPEGKLGRSGARNAGIRKAAEKDAEWIFFLDADDLMAPSAFEYASPYLEKYDGIWGCIWTVEKGEKTAGERPEQLPFLFSMHDLLSCDPYLSLQMGHFVKTSLALDTPFDETLDTGEDFDYYLRIWEEYKCIKIPLPLFYNRRGTHSLGPRSARGTEWQQQVEMLIKSYLKRYGGLFENER
jgi:tetratricopeptide (TPR) repeat protein/glycosyltransferase involved in cell wall biosynthesis